MSTVTESDLQEIKALITNLETKLETKFNEVDKKLNEVDKRIIEVIGEVKTVNAKVDSLEKLVNNALTNFDKRLTNLEFVYRSVFVGMLLALLTAAVKMFVFDKRV